MQRVLCRRGMKERAQNTGINKESNGRGKYARADKNERVKRSVYW